MQPLLLLHLHRPPRLPKRVLVVMMMAASISSTLLLKLAAAVEEQVVVATLQPQQLPQLLRVAQI